MGAAEPAGGGVSGGEGVRFGAEYDGVSVLDGAELGLYGTKRADVQVSRTPARLYSQGRLYRDQDVTAAGFATALTRRGYGFARASACRLRVPGRRSTLAFYRYRAALVAFRQPF